MIQTRVLITTPLSHQRLCRNAEISGLQWLALGVQAAHLLPRETASQAQYAALSASAAPSPYTETLIRIEALIVALQQAQGEIERLANHAHAWNGDQLDNEMLAETRERLGDIERWPHSDQQA